MTRANAIAVLTKRGALAALAAALRVNKSTATRWIKRRIPAERVLEIERVTGVSRSDLRPDLYPPSEPKDAA